MGNESDSICYYIFCRNAHPEAPQSESSWAWRIQYLTWDTNVLDGEPHEPVVLNGVVPSLDRNKDWYARSNIEKRLDFALTEEMLLYPLKGDDVLHSIVVARSTSL